MAAETKLKVLVAVEFVDPSAIPCARAEDGDGSDGLWVVLRAFVAEQNAPVGKLEAELAQKVKHYFDGQPLEYRVMDEQWANGCRPESLALCPVPFRRSTTIEVQWGDTKHPITIGDSQGALNVASRWGQIAAVNNLDLHIGLSEPDPKGAGEAVRTCLTLEQTEQIRRWLIDVVERIRAAADLPPEAPATADEAQTGTERDDARRAIAFANAARDYLSPKLNTSVPADRKEFAKELRKTCQLGDWTRDDTTNSVRISETDNAKRFFEFWKADASEQLREAYRDWIRRKGVSDNEPFPAAFDDGPAPPIFKYPARVLCSPGSEDQTKCEAATASPVDQASIESPTETPCTDHDTYAEIFYQQWQQEFARANDEQLTSLTQELTWALLAGERLYWPKADNSDERLLWLPDTQIPGTDGIADAPARVDCADGTTWRWTSSLSLLQCTVRVDDDKWSASIGSKRLTLSIQPEGGERQTLLPPKDKDWNSYWTDQFGKNLRTYAEEAGWAEKNREQLRGKAERVLLQGAKSMNAMGQDAPGYVLWQPPYKQLDQTEFKLDAPVDENTRKSWLYEVPMPLLDLLEARPAAYLPAPRAPETPATAETVEQPKPFVQLTPQRLVLRMGATKSEDNDLLDRSLEADERFTQRRGIVVSVTAAVLTRGPAGGAAAGSVSTAPLRLALLDKASDTVLRLQLPNAEEDGTPYCAEDLVAVQTLLSAPQSEFYLQIGNGPWLLLAAEKVVLAKKEPALYWIADEAFSLNPNEAKALRLLIVAGGDQKPPYTGSFNAILGHPVEKAQADKTSTAPAIVVAPSKFFDFRFGHSTETLAFAVEHVRTQPAGPILEATQPPLPAPRKYEKLGPLWRQVVNTPKGWLWLVYRPKERAKPKGGGTPTDEKTEAWRLTTGGHLRPFTLKEDRPGCTTEDPDDQTLYFSFVETFQAEPTDRDDLADQRIDVADLPESRRFALWCRAGQDPRYTLVLGVDHQLGLRDYLDASGSFPLRTASVVQHPAEVRRTKIEGESKQTTVGQVSTAQQAEERSTIDLLSWHLNGSDVVLKLNFEAVGALFEPLPGADESPADAHIIAERAPLLRQMYEALLDLLRDWESETRQPNDLSWATRECVVEGWRYDFGHRGAPETDPADCAVAEPNRATANQADGPLPAAMRRSHAMSALLRLESSTRGRIAWSVQEKDKEALADLLGAAERQTREPEKAQSGGLGAQIADAVQALGDALSRGTADDTKPDGRQEGPDLNSFVLVLRELLKSPPEIVGKVVDSSGNSKAIAGVVDAADVVRVGLRITRRAERVIAQNDQKALEPLMRAVPFRESVAGDVIGLHDALLERPPHQDDPTSQIRLPLLADPKRANAFHGEAAERAVRYLRHTDDAGGQAESSPRTAFRWIRRTAGAPGCIDCKRDGNGVEDPVRAATREQTIVAALTGAGAPYSVVRKGRAPGKPSDAPPEAMGAKAWFYTFPWAIAAPAAWDGLGDRRSTQEFLAFLLGLLEELCRGQGPVLEQVVAPEVNAGPEAVSLTRQMVDAMEDARLLRSQVAERLCSEDFLALVEDAGCEAQSAKWSGRFRNGEKSEENFEADKALLGRIEPIRSAVEPQVRAGIRERLARDLSIANTAKAFAVHVVEVSSTSAAQNTPAQRITALQIAKTISRPAEGAGTAAAGGSTETETTGGAPAWIARLQQATKSDSGWRQDIDRFSFGEFFAVPIGAAGSPPTAAATVATAVIDILDDATYDNDFEIFHKGCKAQTIDDLLEGKDDPLGMRVTPVHHNPEWREWTWDKGTKNWKITAARYLIPSKLAPATPQYLQHSDESDASKQTGALGVVLANENWKAETIDLKDGVAGSNNASWKKLDKVSDWSGKPRDGETTRLDTYLQHVCFEITGDEEAGTESLPRTDDPDRLMEALRNDVFLIELEDKAPGTQDMADAQGIASDEQQSKDARKVFDEDSRLAGWYRYFRAQQQSATADAALPPPVPIDRIGNELRWFLGTPKPGAASAAQTDLQTPDKPEGWQVLKREVFTASTKCVSDDDDKSLSLFYVVQKVEGWAIERTGKDDPRIVRVALYSRQGKKENSDSPQLMLRVSFVGSVFRRYRIRLAHRRNARDVDLDGDPDINPVFTMETRTPWVTLPQVTVRWRGKDAQLLGVRVRNSDKNEISGTMLLRKLDGPDLVGPTYKEWLTSGTLVTSQQGFGKLAASGDRLGFPAGKDADCEIRAFRYALQPDFGRVVLDGVQQGKQKSELQSTPGPRLVGVGRTARSKARNPAEVDLRGLFNAEKGPGAFRQAVSLEWRVNDEAVLRIDGWRIKWT